VKNQLKYCRLARRAADREAAYQGLKDLLCPSQPFRALTLQILRDNGVKRAR
jgi:hypothetical protein